MGPDEVAQDGPLAEVYRSKVQTPQYFPAKLPEQKCNPDGWLGAGILFWALQKALVASPDNSHFSLWRRGDQKSGTSLNQYVERSFY